MLRNIMLTVAYEGSAYRGWQIQPNGLTVQECIERASERLFGKRHKLYCAGRTDAGVHAIGQVANFHTESSIAANQIRRGLQAYLPDDISIVQSCEVDPEFHSTFSAIKKRYRYLIYDGDVMPPFYRRFAHRHKGMLQADRIAEALPDLLGRQDFRCFETQYPNKATSVRNIMEANIRRLPVWDLWKGHHEWQSSDARHHEAADCPLLCFEVMADGFLYNMVRAIVGTFIQIGRGRKPVSHLKDVIQSLDRGEAGTNVPSEGLYLVKVDYPEELMQPPVKSEDICESIEDVK
ncbi:MAG: tRNA pseudouridine(38-40) synthase TruA [Fuerstiella sp.]